MCNLYPVETTFSASKTPLDGGESSIYSVMMCESDQTVSWMSSWKQYCDAHTTLQEKVYSFFFFLNHSDTMPPGGTVGESLSNKCSRWAPSHPTLRWTALCELESNKICLCCLIQLPSKKKNWLDIYFFSCAWASDAIFWIKICMCYFHKYWISVLIQLTSKCSGSERGCCIRLKRRSNLARDTGETNPKHIQENRRAFSIISMERWAQCLYY